jgi:hypothetical protein
MSSDTYPITYAGDTPGADNNTYVLYNSALTDANKWGGLKRKYYLLALKTSAVGTLNGYASSDGGSTWHQFYQRQVPATESVLMRNVPVRIDMHKDVKFEWVNGGSEQTTWYVSQVLSPSDNAGYGTGYDDPSYWVDQSMAHAVTVTGGAIQIGPEGRLLVQIQWAATGTPVGTLSLEFSLDGATWKTVPGASTEFTQPAGSAGDIVCSWRELQPFKRVRLKYVSTSGGAANTSLNAQTTTW